MGAGDLDRQQLCHWAESGEGQTEQNMEWKQLSLESYRRSSCCPVSPKANTVPRASSLCREEGEGEEFSDPVKPVVSTTVSRETLA